MTTCSCPGCSEPGLYSCSFCQSSLYCSIACQKKDWLSHKETCEGHLLKQGLTHLQKARELGQDGDCEESLRYNNLALTVLNRLKDRPIEILSDALELKCDTLSTMGQHKQALESAKERYTTTMARKRAPLDSKMGELSQSTTSTTTEEDKLILLQRQIESLRCELLDNENQLVELQRVHDEDLAKQIAVFEAACEEKATKIRDLEEKCRLHEEEGCRRKEQLLAMDDDKKVGRILVMHCIVLAFHSLYLAYLLVCLCVFFGLCVHVCYWYDRKCRPRWLCYNTKSSNA